MIILILLFLLVALFCYFFIGWAKVNKNIVWGVNFSQERAERFGLNWKEVFLAILDDLGAKNIKIAASWDYIEGGKKGSYYFDDLDWQMQKAQDAGAKVILAIGRKTPGWPECHLPKWAKNKSKEEQQSAILDLLKNIAERYKNSSALKYWQVENEPFFAFGDCSWRDDNFLKKEIALVKSIDPSRPIIISDSGELSLWIHASYYGDIVSATLYRKAWFREFNSYVNYPFPPIFYKRKADLINFLFHKKVICGELQGEPWGPEWNYTLPVQEQLKSMDLKEFKSNIAFAQKTGLNEFYFWGTEWWYWMKQTQNYSEFWDAAKNLFR